jgi:hypothetical protein
VKKEFLILIQISFFLISCINQEFFIQDKKEYNNAKIKFDDSLKVFLPPKLSKNTINIEYIYSVGQQSNYLAGIILTEQINTNDYIIKTEFFKKTAKQILTPSDSCTFYVEFSGSGEAKNRYNESFSNLHKYCLNYSLPIPLFINEQDTKLFLIDSNYKHISSNYLKNSILYVLSAKPGKFLLNDKLIDSKGLPEEWKNGYSTGVLANDIKNEITYWLIIW